MKDYSGTFLITLGARLVNDEVTGCRKMAAECLKSMLGRLSKPDRDPLFDVITVWLKDRQVSLKKKFECTSFILTVFCLINNVFVSTVCKGILKFAVASFFSMKSYFFLKKKEAPRSYF